MPARAVAAWRSSPRFRSRDRRIATPIGEGQGRRATQTGCDAKGQTTRARSPAAEVACTRPLPFIPRVGPRHRRRRPRAPMVSLATAGQPGMQQLSRSAQPLPDIVCHGKPQKEEQDDIEGGEIESDVHSDYGGKPQTRAVKTVENQKVDVENRR